LVSIRQNLLNLNQTQRDKPGGQQFSYMGLFDIFKKTDGTNEAVPQQAVNKEIVNEQVIPVFSDEQRLSLEKTQSIANLLAVPKSERNDQWLDQFLLDLPKASFRGGTPQVIAGPDGFPYFQLFLPAPGEEFQSFAIEVMIPEFLLERGFGVLINPGEIEPDWVLSYGDVLNYSLNGSFFTYESAFSSHNDVEDVVGEGEEIMVGQPAETILPVHTRTLLKDFFVLNGIQEPKVLMMVRKKGEDVYQDLAFNITPDQFETEEQYKNMMQTVTWYLPRHYSLIGLHHSDVGDGFMPL